MTKPLFRPDALGHNENTFLGEILLTRPVSFTFLSFLALAAACTIVAYLALGHYTRKARCSGYLVPDRGLIKIYSQQVGEIRSLKVVEGQAVRKGDTLAIVSGERASSKGNTLDEVAAQMSSRIASLTVEKDKIHQIYAEQSRSASQRVRKMSEEHDRLVEAIAAQSQRVRLAQTVVGRYEQLSHEGFVAELAAQEKVGDLLDQQNRLRELERARNAGEREALALQSDLSNLPLRERNELAALDRTIAELAALKIENEAQREVFVLAPEDGIVTALQTDRGKQAALAQPLMSLIPAGASLRADLYLPTRAVGFVRQGSIAQLQYQAFPYQKFGSHRGSVINVSHTAVPAQELPFPAATADVYYVLQVRPDEDSVLADGTRQALRAGMQVDADIWLDRRTLLEWIMEPLYSVSGRV